VAAADIVYVVEKASNRRTAQRYSIAP